MVSLWGFRSASLEEEKGGSELKESRVEPGICGGLEFVWFLFWLIKVTYQKAWRGPNCNIRQDLGPLVHYPKRVEGIVNAKLFVAGWGGSNSNQWQSDFCSVGLGSTSNRFGRRRNVFKLCPMRWSF